MKLAFYTLGCKVNQFETQAMELQAREDGHTLVDCQEDADAYIINTCTVTAVSDKKSRQILHRIRREHPKAVIAVCGCFSQINPEKAIELACADIIAGTGDRLGLLRRVEEMVQTREFRLTAAPVTMVDQARERREYEMLPAGGLAERTRAMIKVQDGCSNFCSYCIIPYARGPVRSMPLCDAVKQAEKLARKGYREVVVTGIEISSYGRDLSPASSLVELMEALLSAVPQVRFRLGSLEPRTIDQDFCERLAGYANLCRQFHLSLQSGCDATLRRMRRRYSTDRYLESVGLVKTAFPGCGVTTDVIVGFPEENEAEFSETMEFVARCGFSDMHIFPYSRRPGTPAANMPGQVPRRVKEARAHTLSRLARTMKQEFLASRVGAAEQVLFEQRDDSGTWIGHAGNYAAVCVRQEENLKNRLLEVKITGADEKRLYGTVTLPDKDSGLECF